MQLRQQIGIFRLRRAIAAALSILLAFIPMVAHASTMEAEACIGRMLRLTGTQAPTVQNINEMRSVCEQMSLATYRAQTEAATARIYEAQLTQNTVMLWLVVILTMGGIGLAAVQLWATYRLAKAGQGALADGGEATIEHGKIVVRSSVVGIIILAMSFAFFSMYVLYVYRISESSGIGSVPVPVGPAPPAAAAPPVPAGAHEVPQ